MIGFSLVLFSFRQHGLNTCSKFISPMVKSAFSLSATDFDDTLVVYNPVADTYIGRSSLGGPLGINT